MVVGKNGVLVKLNSIPERTISKHLKNKIGLLIECPIDNPDAFKADIIKYAPEGNPLRLWVESEEFDLANNINKLN